MSDLFGNHIVGFLTRRLICCSHIADNWINLSLSRNTTEISIRNLTAGTAYTIRVGAVYLTHTEVFSPEVKVTTLPDSLAPSKFYSLRKLPLAIYIFIFAQNINCGCTLEPPRRGGSNEYPQSMFWSKNKNNR